MKKSYLFLKLMLVVASFSTMQLKGQTIPVGTPLLEDSYRRAQLLGQIDSTISFTSRPFFPSAALNLKNSFDPDEDLEKEHSLKFDGTFSFDRNRGFVQLLPITRLKQYNSHHPEGLNDGAMIPAIGYQFLFSGGFFIKYSLLSIQLRPEAVYAENRAYDGFPDEFSDQIWANYSRYLNNIDLPERFGESTYQKLSWGQSSIRLTYSSLSIGLSNENLWWGPGIHNALLMTNSAPGFKHLTLNTVKPIRTIIGSFEGQIIAGRLEGSGFTPLGADRMKLHQNLYVPKPEGWRYFNGMVFSYQPRWVPGLFLGLTRSFYMYRNDMGNSFGDYLPIFDVFRKKVIGEKSEDARKLDQLVSLFMRWVWTEEHGEIYFEYGREDHAWDLRDLTLEPSYSAANIIGFRKLFGLNTLKDEFIQINLELTQMAMDNTTINRSGGSWYLHHQIVSGYTNEGQMLGAGIGPGSNSQTLNVSWVKKLKTLGVQFERVVHNNDFHVLALKDNRTDWVDFSIALLAEWNYKHLLFNARLESVRAMNYQWLYQPTTKQNCIPVYWNPAKDVFNFHVQLGVSYRF